MTLRIRIDLSYDGTAFSGWAAQPGRRTVEDTLSGALTTILRSPTPVRLVVAGRTDAGVHARGQVCHADVDPAGWEKVRGRSRPLARGGRRDPAARHPPRRPDGPAGQPWPRRASTPASPRCGGATSTGSATTRPPWTRCAGTTPCWCVGRSTSRAWTGPRAACSACTTSRPSASAGPGRHHRAHPARPPLGPRARRHGRGHGRRRRLLPQHGPRRSSGRSCPWARGASRSTCRAQVLRGGVRDSRVRVMPPHGLSLEEVTYPPDDELAARAAESRVRRVLPG